MSQATLLLLNIAPPSADSCTVMILLSNVQHSLLNHASKYSIIVNEKLNRW